MSLFLSDKLGKIVLAAFITVNGNQGVVFPDQGMALVIVLLCGADKGADRLRFFVLSEKDLSPPFAPPRTVIFCRFLCAGGENKKSRFRLEIRILLSFAFLQSGTTSNINVKLLSI